MQRRIIQQLLSSLDVFVSVNAQSRLVIDIEGVPYYAGLLNAHTSNNIPTAKNDPSRLTNCKYAIVYHKPSDMLWVIPTNNIPACDFFRLGKQYDDYKITQQLPSKITELLMQKKTSKHTNDEVSDDELVRMLEGKESDNEHDVQADNKIQPDKEADGE